MVTLLIAMAVCVCVCVGSLALDIQIRFKLIAQCPLPKLGAQLMAHTVGRAAFSLVLASI